MAGVPVRLQPVPAAVRSQHHRGCRDCLGWVPGVIAVKTTMLNALAGSIPPRERVVTCEEVFVLRIEHRCLVALQCRQPSLEGTGEINLRRLVKEALRMRPRRIIIGEVREAESLDMLIALNAGVPGMCTATISRVRRRPRSSTSR